MNYEFHPEALAELEDAARYYAKVQQGLEQRFIASVETAIQKLVAQPSAYGILEQDIRRCLTRVFPYALLYSIEPHCLAPGSLDRVEC